ncbi:hypothetical protein J4446_02300 [Candidatus Woesearchaeota archaeon]|nr:hypothetical protein [Candidatus Woesearchaeota archaeon]
MLRDRRDRRLNEIILYGTVAHRGIENRFPGKPMLYIINSNYNHINLVPAVYIPRSYAKTLQPEQQVRIIARPSILHKGRYVSRNIEIL